MKIIAEEKMENCFESDFVFKYFIDTQWTKEAIEALDSLGHLRYYDSFPKPMFHIQCFDGTIMKGVQGTNECRVIFSRDGPDMAKKSFKQRFEEVLFKGG